MEYRKTHGRFVTSDQIIRCDGFHIIYRVYCIVFFWKYRKLSYIGYALLALLIVFMIDGSIFYPPTLMNIFLVLGMSKPYIEKEEVIYE